MSFCLDDGAELVYGPASAHELPTAILSEPSGQSSGFPVDELSSRAEINDTDRTAILRSTGADAEREESSGDSQKGRGLSADRSIEPPGIAGSRQLRVAIFGIAVTLVVAAFFGYRYINADTKQIDSIAVLPFENGSGNGELDYLSDGVSESVIDRLSQVPHLKVISRSSSFRYRGPNLNLKEIAAALGVEAIVTGRVTPRGDNYSLRVELIDAREDKQLWGESFTRRASDLQELHADISREIARKLRLQLSGPETPQLAGHGTADPLAYEAFVKGRFFVSKPGDDNAYKAGEHFERATTLDPNYALAWAYLANNLGGFRDLTPGQRRSRRRSAALKAVELAPNLAEAHYALAQVKFNDWEWAEAEREYRLAIELNPNLARARSGLSGYLTVMGRYDEAIAEAKQAVELDPVDFVSAARLSSSFRNARRFDESIEAAKRAIEIEPNFFFTRIVLADAYTAKGMYRDAIAQYQEGLRMRGGDAPNIVALLAVIFVKTGERGKAEEILENLKAKSRAPTELALLYDSLGRRDEAFAVLEKEVAEHRGDLGFMRVNPLFDNLRPDPRFQDLLRRMGLPRT